MKETDTSAGIINGDSKETKWLNRAVRILGMVDMLLICILQ